MLTDVLCWLLSWLGHEAKKAAMPAATTPKHNSLFILMSCSFRAQTFHPQASPLSFRLVFSGMVFDAEEYRKMTGYVNVNLTRG